MSAERPAPLHTLPIPPTLEGMRRQHAEHAAATRRFELAQEPPAPARPARSPSGVFDWHHTGI